MKDFAKSIYVGNATPANIEKIPDNWRPGYEKAGYVVHYDNNMKMKWFATEEEAKKFASSVGNDTPAEYAKRPPKVVGGNSLPEELEKDVEKKDEEKVEEVKKLEKTENCGTQNGLKRAFSAMAKNKKVKNSAVREYKHSDGRVAQIDFNEDGSDADMSIYEGSKEIEQRNFSTIRDAEQYVTSHGFRRI